MTEPHLKRRVHAVLHEIAALLEDLVNNGHAAVVNLRVLGLSSEDYAAVRSALGSGAVSASIQAEGPSALEETRFPGVWWVTHRDMAGHVVAEVIEICHVPSMLCAPTQDIALGAAALTRELAK